MGASELASLTEGAKGKAEQMRRVHRKLMDWYLLEREVQAINRYQMALDGDFYDGLQWSTEDAEEIESRGQKAIVYNEVAPMVDWIIGTERRSRVDWNVLPRAEDDVLAADIKAKLLKHVSDVNSAAYQRSLAFGEAVKCGLSWIEDSINTDPTEEMLFSGWESWRYVLHDSAALKPDTDRHCRYIFRWRWVDSDVAKAMLPGNDDAIHRAQWAGSFLLNDDEDSYYLGTRLSDNEQQSLGRRTYVADSAILNNRRERVKLIEAWFRHPMPVKRLYGADYDGEEYDPRNPEHVMVESQGIAGVRQSVEMRMHVMIMTEKDPLWFGRSPYKHNRFPFTPVWCYRRGRDGAPYGAIRRVRDVQEDLNKRMSKALFILSTNQIIADEDASNDFNRLRDEADDPQGTILKKRGSELTLHRDSEMGKSQLELARMDVEKIQHSSGVNQDNLGRQTNAESGVAIEARQLQGAVTTTEPFDNLREATRISGKKQLSLVEQYYSRPKVFRLTGTDPGQIDWIKINQPEVQPDGTIRYVNDITASEADFVVSEQDYAGTLREVMFQSISQIASKMPDPMLSLRLLRIAFGFSDFPNKDEIVNELRKITGEPEPGNPKTPEEAQALQEAQAQQMRAMQRQEALAQAAVEKAIAEVQKLNAEADKIRAEAAAAGAETGESPGTAALRDQIQQEQLKAAEERDRLMEALSKTTAELNNKVLEIKTDAATRVRVAEIEAQAQERIAREQNEFDKRMAPIHDGIRRLTEQIRAGEQGTAKGDDDGGADE